MKKIFIVILNYNSEKDTEECLDSLLKIKTSGFLVNAIVIDNSENKFDLDVIKYKKINIKKIDTLKNLGFSGGMNTGIKHSLNEGADYVLVMNNDTIVAENFIQELFNFSEKNSNAGIVAPKIYFAKGHEFHKDKYEDAELGKVIWYAGGIMDWNNVIGKHRGVDEVDKGQFDDVMTTDFTSGCAMLIKKEVFENIGFFDEKYFLYYEDADLCIRAKKAGYKIYFVPGSVIWHKNAGSAGGSGSKLQEYYITRNRLLFGNRYAPLRSRIALNREGLSLVFRGREWQKKGARDYFFRHFNRRYDL